MGFYTNKKVFVAGGTGTIGQSLVAELIKREAIVTVASMDMPGYAHEVLPKGIKWINADLRYAENCRTLTKNMDVVFDMTGIKGPTLTNSKTYSSMFVSFLQLQTSLMDAVAKNQVPYYLFAGSVCSYPEMKIPKTEESMWNALPTQNDKYGGLAKRIGELQASAYSEDGTWNGARIVRFSNVYGPGDDFKPSTAQVIPALISKALMQDHVIVQGDGSAIRDFLYVKDASFWACEAIEHLPPCTPINISSGIGISIKDVCSIIRKYIPHNVDFEFAPTAYAGDPIRILSIEKAINLLGYKVLTTLEDGIKYTIDWFYKNKNNLALRGKFYE